MENKKEAKKKENTFESRVIHTEKWRARDGLASTLYLDRIIEKYSATPRSHGFEHGYGK